ncbi:C-type lectin-related protein 4 [Plakobranchus ocellatus]|uniref:C-type lectin-related protein 4 n=1 Tax=Plakobranchus ocellatus TaxID=259542 RepID=A0AAV4A8B2_9GAST|nr:C-type lectin-related protein 4 [Plakobranchus ocellatus]
MAWDKNAGFLFESGSGQCTPVLWIGQGSGGIVIPSGSADAPPGNLYVNSQTTIHCPDGFQEVSYGSEGHVSCLVVLLSLSYESATSKCNAMGGYLASVRTAERLQMAVGLAQGNDMWVGMDDLVQEGEYRWQEDGELLTDTERADVFKPGEPNNNGNEDCVHYRRSNDQLNDSRCSSLKNALCESPPRSVAC